MTGSLDEARSDVPRTVSDEQIDRVLSLKLENSADGRHPWSARAMAQRTGRSQSTVRRIWRAFVLKARRSETFKLSKDPLFTEKVRDVGGRFLSPPDRALVLAADERSQSQALDRAQPLLPMRPGQSSGGPAATSVTAPPTCSRRSTVVISPPPPPLREERPKKDDGDTPAASK